MYKRYEQPIPNRGTEKGLQLWRHLTPLADSKTQQVHPPAPWHGYRQTMGAENQAPGRRGLQCCCQDTWIMHKDVFWQQKTASSTNTVKYNVAWSHGGHHTAQEERLSQCWQEDLPEGPSLHSWLGQGVGVGDWGGGEGRGGKISPRGKWFKRRDGYKKSRASGLTAAPGTTWDVTRQTQGLECRPSARSRGLTQQPLFLTSP